MALAQPPRELQGAIDAAAQLYQVPASILAGVWRIESANTFPNPAVNSSGYGGLFGTTHWNTSTQDQANYAASILHRLFIQYGNWSDALFHYSGGGYRSVPGGSDGASTQPAGPTSQAQPAALSLPNPFDVFKPWVTWWGKPANIWTIGLTATAAAMIAAGFFVYTRPETAEETTA